MTRIDVHAVIPRTRANGPGVRYALWFQGCSLACRGCFNPSTHASGVGQTQGVDAIVSQIRDLEVEIEGVSLSGGEPFQQPAALFELVTAIRRHTRLSVLIFSGFTLEEIVRQPFGRRVLESIDVLVAGRYVARAAYGRTLLGSANQTLHFLTERYGPADLESVPAAEIQIRADGELVMTGIGGAPARLRALGVNENDEHFQGPRTPRLPATGGA